MGRRRGDRVTARSLSAGTGTLRGRAAQPVAPAQRWASIIAFVDSDHEIDRQWIETAVDVLADPTSPRRVRRISPQPCANWVQQQYDGLRARPVRREEVTWLGSGNFAVKRAVFERVGGFNAVLTACEDVDFCNRLRQAGYRIVADPELRSVHFGDPQTLKALFFGELWRGRDNLRVTFADRAPSAIFAVR